MMYLKSGFCRKLATLILILVLIVPVFVACGDNEEETIINTLTATPTQTPTYDKTVTPTATPTSESAGPVKIGAICAWSGPISMAGGMADQAIALVEDQVKQMGGILGGREIKFIRGDDAGQVAQDAAQAKKLILDEKVAALTLGGVTAPGITATAEVAEQYEVPFVGFATIYGVDKMKYSACLCGSEAMLSRIANFLIDYLKPKTVAFLSYDAQDAHQVLDGEEGIVGVRDRLKNAGIDIVYEQYFPQDTQDFSSYLTKIKYLNPDVLVFRPNSEAQAITVAKQIMELGGWGNIKVFGGTEGWTATRPFPGGLNTYTCVLWIPGSDDPGMKAFEDAWMARNKSAPNPTYTYYYNCFWTVIKAMQLAGTDDPIKVANVLRSGNLEWDSAWGHLRIPPNGTGEVNTMVAQIVEGKKLVKVYP